MRLIFTFTFLLLIIKGYSQSAHDGISLRGLETNRSSYYYGEPIQLTFVTKNDDSNTKYYWEPSSDINFLVELVDFQKGEVKPFSYGISHTSYDQWRSNRPPEDAAYETGRVYIMTYNLGPDFGYEQLIKTSSRSTPTISDFTNVLPVGKYKIKITYTLLPISNSIFTSFDFEVKPIPEEENDAFIDYLEAMKYTSISHPFYGDESYNSQHTHSLENFTKKYPNSRYSQHAYNILINKVYQYHSKNISIERRRQAITQYLREDRIHLSELKFEKSLRAKKLIDSKFVIGSEIEVADKVLRNLKKEDPLVSEILIDRLKSKSNYKRLKNYACEEQ